MKESLGRGIAPMTSSSSKDSSMSQHKSPKTAVVAFKVEKDLADILNELPNKSAFIRKAIVAQLEMTCPMCRGGGVLPKWLHDHYAEIMEKMSDRDCEGCGTAATMLPDPAELTPQDRERFEQFFHGGPFYCGTCFTKAPACGDCGWHIKADQVKKHKLAHKA